MDPAQLRISDSDRDRVTGLLREAAGEGRLTPAETEERIAQLPASRTYGDLDRLVADLPIAPPSSVVQLPVTTGQGSGIGARGGQEEQVLRLDGGFSTDERTGSWTLPRRIEAHGTMGTVRIDCMEALCPHPEVQIYVSGGAGAIKVIVPGGWAANIDEVRKSMGSAKSKVLDSPHPGCPLLVFDGNMGMGSLIVRNPNWFDRRRQLRRLRKRRKLELTTGWAESNPELENPSNLR